MAVNLKKTTVNYDAAVTRTELKTAALEKTVIDAVAETKPVEKKLSANDVKLVGDGNRNKGVLRRRRKKSDKKKELEKKRREQQAREQASRTSKARRYAKEMRNRDAVGRIAKRKRQEAMLTITNADDMLANAILATDNKKFDHLIYGTATSDIEAELDEMFDDELDNAT